MMAMCEPETVAYMVQQANAKLGIPPRMMQDDLVAGTIAGLDTIKATVMGAVFHLLEPANVSWKRSTNSGQRQET
ncbi:putative cytochrome P450 [Arthroderma uncinatum]|uniref:putative cytochrome P450 n=1 Tax=Arthroderma uncinatum TaxID=74035 RepID=UPI00144AA095|nr:putative cytochrome P450 [Arthroderma uncinatum]KAF3482141.1 putative cytochrome P450 [Arthroderma uncinatum]